MNFLNFTEIADELNIDKGSKHEAHMYTKTYESYLSKFINQKPVIVEIGINDPRFPGGCLKFWDKIFENMEYYGFDITDCTHLEYNKTKIKTFQGDQNNPKDLENFVSDYSISKRIDFIIDDGSHISEHIITSFKTLYNHLKLGGFYFIEDLHAGYAEKEKTLQTIQEHINQNNLPLKFLELVNHKLLIIEK